MTLHWWMHWFWITRAVAVTTQLLLLLSAVQTVPLPPSTHHPQVQNIKSLSVTSWASVLPPLYADTSVSSQQREETSPVWTSSPEIEEPFYPTSAPSGHVNIPGTPQGLSRLFSWPPETYLPFGEERAPTQLLSESGDQSFVSNGKVFLYPNPNVVPHQFPGEEELQQDSDIFIEPHALPLHAASSRLHDEENQTIPSIGSNHSYVASDSTPKILENSNSSQIELSSKDTHNHLHSLNYNNTENSNTNLFVAESSDDASDLLGDDIRNVPRLMTRDVRNISQAELSAATSLEDSSINSGNIHNTSSLRSNIRTNKAIGHFPTNPPSPKELETIPNSDVDAVHGLKHKSETKPENIKKSDSVDSQITGRIKEAISDSAPGELSAGDNIKVSEKDEHKESVDTRVLPEDVEMSDSPYNPVGTLNSTILGSQTPAGVSKYSSSSLNVSEGETVNSKKNNVETGNSRITSSNHNKTTGNISDVSDTKEHVNNKAKELTSLASTVQPANSTLQGKKHINGTQILNQTGSADETNSSVAGGGLPFSGNISSHTNLGRAASRSLEEDETTLVPSVAPVSRSRVAAPSSDVSRRGLDAASITGISLGIVVFAGLAGAISFILYRRRYLNKPQTLNDKCSNPDSSGYIDDSTLRENSEEMYSLDNDSFLNSLEAMTIQNYWTDNVKHTKL